MLSIFDEDYEPPVDLLDIGELIEQELERKLRKRSKEWKEWREKINYLITQYNKLSNHQSYALR